MKLVKSFVGRWRIVEMEMWDQDYVDMEVPGYIRVDKDGNGDFQFGPVSGDIDCRVERCGDSSRLEFSWAGGDDGDPICGRGWAIAESGELRGRIFLHQGDDSAFRAVQGD